MIDDLNKGKACKHSRLSVAPESPLNGRPRRLVLIVTGVLVAVLVTTLVLAFCGIESFGFIAAFPPVPLLEVAPMLPECAFVQTHFLSWLSPIGFGLIFILPGISLFVLAWAGPPIVALLHRKLAFATWPKRRKTYLAIALVAVCILLAESAAISDVLRHRMTACFQVFIFWLIGVAVFAIIVGIIAVIVQCVCFRLNPAGRAWPVFAVALYLVGCLTIGLIGFAMIWNDQRPTRERHASWAAEIAADPVSLRGSDINAEDLKLLRDTTRLRRLDLNYCCVIGSDMQCLAGLKQLQSLSLQGALADDGSADSALEHVKALTQLHELNVSSNFGITDIGLENLKGLTQLQKLNIGITRTTDAGLEHLKQMTELRELDLKSTDITDAGLEHLKRLTKLEELSLEDTRITDAGLERLKAFPNLKILRLRGTAITDAGLAHLAGLSQLQDVNLAETKVTAQGVKNLQRALPTCNVW